MFKLKKLSIVAALSLVLAACGGGDDTSDGDSGNGEGESNGDVNYSEEVDYTIIGIEPGAGITQATNNAIEEYDSLAGWTQEESSTAAMLTELGDAIENEEEIIVAGWNPHFMFAQYDIKYIDDPKGVYGGEEYISTIVRNGLEDDMPEAYQILDNFNWTLEDMESIMLEAQEKEMEVAAQEWVDENQDTFNSWIEGVESVDGDQIEIVATPWDSERASGEVIRLALEEKGYDVTITPVDPQIVFQAIASGDADASVAPWMPQTHGDFYAQYEGEFEDLGENLTGAKIGLAVPTYMDIESIEDLEPAE